MLYLGIVAVVFMISLIENHRHTPPFKWLSVLLVLILITEGVGYWLDKQKVNQQFLFYFYTPIEYLFLSNLYASQYTSTRVSRWIRISGLLFLGFCIAYAANNNFNLRIAAIPLFLIEWMAILILVLYYFYDLYKNDYLSSIKQTPLFWISVGNFFFYSGTFFVMGLIEEIKKYNLELAKEVFVINTILNILMYSFWAIGFLCLRPTFRRLS